MGGQWKGSTDPALLENEWKMLSASTVGILPRHWKVGDVREVYSVAKVPVLAITQSEPQGAVNQLIGCLQK